ncbi:TetR family transcriptional regulator [Marinobacterium sp. YM272]|uniref:TetR family transcriptional regulator n=1 Tax=Marinobacterium sp. YM272 TaxID=3421654 RepID=UPI003D7F94F0
MVRRSREEAEATRQGLLNKALELFAAQGTEAVTMKRIAAEAGVTHGAMYWHFRNKRDLLVQLHLRAEWPFEKHYLDQRQAVQQDALEALEHFLRAALAEFAGNKELQCLYRVFHYGRGRSPELAELEPVLNQELDSWRDFIHYFLKQARKQKQLRKKLDLDLLSDSLLIAIIGAIDLWLTVPERFDLRKQADYLLATQIQGLRVLKSSMV